jgi:hypothetical protein
MTRPRGAGQVWGVLTNGSNGAGGSPLRVSYSAMSSLAAEDPHLDPPLRTPRGASGARPPSGQPPRQRRACPALRLPPPRRRAAPERQRLHCKVTQSPLPRAAEASWATDRPASGLARRGSASGDHGAEADAAAEAEAQRRLLREGSGAELAGRALEPSGALEPQTAQTSAGISWTRMQEEASPQSNRSPAPPKGHAPPGNPRAHRTGVPARSPPRDGVASPAFSPAAPADAGAAAPRGSGARPSPIRVGSCSGSNNDSLGFFASPPPMAPATAQSLPAARSPALGASESSAAAREGGLDLFSEPLDVDALFAEVGRARLSARAPASTTKRPPQDRRALSAGTSLRQVQSLWAKFGGRGAGGAREGRLDKAQVQEPPALLLQARLGGNRDK